MWMRGGTSKGLYFLKDDIPNDIAKRKDFLLSVFGSPDNLQINGVGGGNPLTSKVAIVSKSKRSDVDVDYLFLQVAVDDYVVSSTQNCGNILAGIAPFAIERGLIKPEKDKTSVRIFMENSKQIAIATVDTPDGKLTYSGNTFIDGVTLPSSPISLEFLDIEGSLCGELLPSGNIKDEIDGYTVTMIDNGMPCVIIAASQLGLNGKDNESWRCERENGTENDNCEQTSKRWYDKYANIYSASVPSLYRCFWCHFSRNRLSDRRHSYQ